MFLSRITLRDRRALLRLPANAYGLHKAVWDLFTDGPDRRRDFLFRVEEGTGLSLLAVSARPPRASSDAWRVEVRDYAPALRPGDRLTFALRANPVRTGRNADGRPARFDVVMDAKHALKVQGVPREQWPPLSELEREAGARWLASRAERLGFRLETVGLNVDGYRLHRFPKEGREVSFATLDFQGLLEVLDVERFQRTLAEGVGPGKSFGCGLLLVRRASSCCPT
ncbi:type I-E CRISPR-associated protein Cas6/Cse3/CasE [Desulfovibrio aminophilus]|jgi:CRISPR system Cascade subunit CasE|nr:type I-E CRISPR-associated protein Cas6/Cse3/CasE [Desulfovibrio aminophilus]MCM0754903.1 type I-E CRISPR-associated protein Cas6/Cse3/CasE [Desulfovibrio aminophilus]